MIDMIKLANRNECTGCMACADSCNRHAISMPLMKDGHYYPAINDQSCVDCGICLRTCPVLNGFDYKKKTKDSTPFAAWNTNNEQRMTSSSGGVFAAIATTILNKGGAVFGVAIRNSQAYHVCIDDIKDLHLIQGSKYQQSYAVGIYAEVKKRLLDGILVLFSGTACQVAGLLSYLKKPFDNLITIDNICTGVPSRLPIKRYLRESGDSEIIGYRDKIDGWEGGLHLRTVNNSTICRDAKYSNLVTKSFSGQFTNRISCANCLFNGLYRKADLTVADFWGDKKYLEQHHDGLSVLIVHSQKGDNIARESTLEMHESSFGEIVQKNPRLIVGKVFGAKYRLRRIFVPYAFEHFSTKTLLPLCCGVYDSNFVWAPVRLYRYLFWRFSKFVLRIRVNNTLKEQL